MKTPEYTVKEIKEMIDNMSGMYDLARVVDPRECRILSFGDDGSVGMRERCYGVWDSDHRCANCSSRTACQTGHNQKKEEHFKDHIFDIQSNPVKVILEDGDSYDAVLELISVSSDDGVAEVDLPNDRASENNPGRAAEYFADHDNLTKVLNAEAFYEHSRDAMAASDEASWVMIAADIMSFHMVNDLFGIEKGNDVLMRTADLLSQLATKDNGLCGRLVNDRFAMLIPASAYKEEDLLRLSEELETFDDFGVYKLHIHFGVFNVTDPTLPVHVMCNRARSALRTIRHDVRRVVAYYDDEMHAGDLFEQKIINSFDRMIESGRYKMYLQPLVGADGKPFGAEALVRFIANDGSVVPPGRFIETLERAGLIHELDMYIWEQAASQLSKWKGTRRDYLCISVNMSARDLYSVDVYETLSDLIDKYDIDPGKLRLEITETAFVENPKEAAEVITKLRDAGFCIEIDDFGKGYSSLGLLKDVCADILKLDMSFITDTENKSRNDIILDSVIGMAGSLGMDVISEGVETEAQLASLRSMGCNHFQGYYFSRPVPISEFEARY